MTLADFVADYTIRQDTTQGYANQLRWMVAAFERHLGRPAEMADLTSSTINAWLASLRDSVSPDTRSSRRRMLLSLSGDAARLGLIPPINRDMIARVKVRPSQPDGLTWEEARHVLQSINIRGGPHERWLRFTYRETGITRRGWWRAYLAACWDTGAPADLRILKWADIQEGGRVYLLRSKTGKPLRWALSDYTVYALDQIKEPARDLVFPLPGNMRLFRREAHKILCTIAGLANKSLGGFRSGAGTDAELRHGQGAGSQLLGNTPAVFARHYEVASVIQRDVLAPKPLMETK